MAVTVWTLIATCACHAAVFALVVTSRRMSWVWAVLASYFVFIGVQRGRQAKRSRSSVPWERHTITLWAGQLICSIALALAILPLDWELPAERVLPWYPSLAVLYALALFVQGSISWGSYFLASFLYMAVAIALRFVGPAAPLVFLAVHVPVILILVRGGSRSPPISQAT